MPSNQPSFFDQDGMLELRALSGASGGKLIDWLGHGYYAAKPYSPRFPCMLITEWLCADIASFLGLPIPARQIVIFKGQKWLGFEWRGDAKSFIPGMETKLTNPEMIVGMLSFDIFVCNRDRHDGNIVLQHPSPQSTQLTCYLIDHSHALIGEMPNIDALNNFLRNSSDPDAFLRANERLRGLVKESADFGPWITKIRTLTRANLDESVSRIPPEWRPTPDETERLLDFIIGRKDRVDSLIDAGRSNFPNLKM